MGSHWSFTNPHAETSEGETDGDHEMAPRNIQVPHELPLSIDPSFYGTLFTSMITVDILLAHEFIACRKSVSHRIFE
jgi:hypothetical protein